MGARCEQLGFVAFTSAVWNVLCESVCLHVSPGVSMKILNGPYVHN